MADNGGGWSWIVWVSVACYLRPMTGQRVKDQSETAWCNLDSYDTTCTIFPKHPHRNISQKNKSMSANKFHETSFSQKTWLKLMPEIINSSLASLVPSFLSSVSLLMLSSALELKSLTEYLRQTAQPNWFTVTSCEYLSKSQHSPPRTQKPYLI